MPKVDLPIHGNKMAQVTNSGGIPIRGDVLFTNHKGEEKSGIKKRNLKTLGKLGPALKRLLLPEEAVIYVLRANTALSVVEQLTQGWWTYYLAMAAIVITNKRILFFPVKRDGAWRESVRSAQWGDVAVVRPKGFLSRTLNFSFKNGVKQSYTRVRGADAKKIGAIAPTLLAEGVSEISPAHGRYNFVPIVAAH